MTIEIFIYGAGGHGKVVFHVLRAAGCNVGGFFDDKVRGSHCGRPVYSSDEINKYGDKLNCHVAIGNNDIRRQVQGKISEQGCWLQSAIHPGSLVYPGVRIGSGSLILPHAVLGPDAVLGDGCIVNHNAVIDHDCVIGTFCHIAPSATLGGGVQVGNTCLIGAGAVVLPGITIGSNAVVGAGAIVTQDVADGLVVIGNPARQVVRGSSC